MSSSTDPPTDADEPTATQHQAWIAIVFTGLVIGAAFIAIYVGLQRDPQPRHVPIAVVSEQLATAVKTGLGETVAVKRVASVADGAVLVRNGDALAVVAPTSPTTLELDYAGAGGFSESGAVRQFVAGFAAGAGATVQEDDIVPLATYDSRGLTAFYVVFGVTLASFILGQGLTAATAKVRLRHRIYATGGFAIAVGLTAATIAGPIYGSLTAPFALLALSLTLLSAASAFATSALGAWLGPAGIGLAVLVLTTIGNATSGATIGIDLLPGWAQAISAKLPPGAAVRAVNNFGYFNGAHTVMPIAVLIIWCLVALGLVLLRPWTKRRATTTVPAGRGRCAPRTRQRQIRPSRELP